MKTFGILTSYLCALLAAHATVGASAASAAPLRGTVATVDNPISSDKTLIYGPFEAGFSAAQTAQFFGCTGDVTIAGGLDTLLGNDCGGG